MFVLGLEGLSNAFVFELTERPDDLSVEELATLTKRILFERIVTGDPRGPKQGRT